MTEEYKKTFAEQVEHESLTLEVTKERVYGINPLEDGIYSNVTESDLARILNKILIGNFAVIKGASKKPEWVQYNSELGIWQPDINGSEVEKATIDFIDVMLDYAETKGDKGYFDFVRMYTFKKNRNMLLQTASTYSEYDKSEFDANPHLLNCKDCIVDLEHPDKVLQHSPKYLMTKCCNVCATLEHKGGATYQEFMNYAFEGDRNVISFVESALGYSLLKGNPEKKYFTVVGKPNTGKSVLANLILAVTGDYSKTVDYSTLQETQKKSGSPHPEVLQLADLHCAVVQEPKSDFVLDSQMIKSITGRDEFNARALYGNDQQVFRVGAKIWFMCNSEPKLYDPAIFDSGRVCLIPMNHVVSAEDRDNQLEEKLLTEESKSYIFGQWLKGLQRYYDDRKAIQEYPKPIKEATEEYGQRSDRILCFFKECGVYAQGVQTKGADAYDLYCSWCSPNKYTPLGRYKFYQGMIEHGFMRPSVTINGNTIRNMVENYRFQLPDDELGF